MAARISIKPSPRAQGVSRSKAKGIDMRKVILLLSAFVLSPLPALAADMPVKAPNFAYPLDLAGWYAGIDTGAAVSRASVTGSSTLFANSLITGKLNAAGGYIGGCVGYIRGNVGSWWAVQGCGDWQNITASAPGIAASVGSRWDSTVEVRLGGTINPVNLMLDTLSNLGVGGLAFPTFIPVAPGGISVAVAPRTYMAGGIDFKGLNGDFFKANGTTVAVSPMIKTGAIWQVLNKNGQSTGGVVDTYAKISFMDKGITVGNVFGTGGAPVVGGHASLGTTYTAGVAYYFGLPKR